MDRRWFIASLVAAGAACAGLNSGCAQKENVGDAAKGEAGKTPAATPTATPAAEPSPSGATVTETPTPDGATPADGRAGKARPKGAASPSPSSTPRPSPTAERVWDDLGDTATIEREREKKRNANRNRPANSNRPRR